MNIFIQKLKKYIIMNIIIFIINSKTVENNVNF